MKTIDVQVKEWFDKTYGNSYFGGFITIDYGTENQKQISLPFQYGYGDKYRDEAFKVLQKEGCITDVQERESYWAYYERKNIIARHTKHENCLKRDVINYSNI